MCKSDFCVPLGTDSYKIGHWNQYPSNTEYVYSYLESRGGRWTDTVFFGLQYFLKKYLVGEVVNIRDVEYARKRCEQHFGKDIFNYEGWKYIVEKHGGKLPVEIWAVPEGLPVPTGHPLIVVQNTDPKCYWLTNYLETLLVQVWYPCTVATQSREMKHLILKYLNRTGDPKLIDFKLHDFGFRGVTCPEQAGLGGLAHLVNFKGTDTMASLEFAKDFYGEDMPGNSIVATEHSVITAYGKDNEVDAYRNMLHQNPEGLVACVSDSYNIFNACRNIWGGILREEVLKRNGTLVIRPDCYDEKTSVYTNRGWVLFSELTKEDLVAQVFDDGSYEFVKPLKYVDEYYSGEMVYIHDEKGKVDLYVTPNHRIVYKNRKGAWVIEEADSIKFFWEKTLVRSAMAPIIGKRLSDMERLMIVFQADGSYCNRIKTGYIRFAFSKQRKKDRLYDLLKRLDLAYNTYTCKDGRQEIRVKVDASFFVKDFSWVDISNLDGSWCQEFVEELSYWDATRRSDYRFKFGTTNKSVAIVVELVVLSAGYGCLCNVTSDNRQAHFSDVYTLHILKDNTVGTQCISKKVCHYEGRIYCVQVPTGRIMVKRRRATAICGNSGNPVSVLCTGNENVFDILWQRFGGTINSKGFRVLDDHVRVIQGDGVDIETIDAILHAMQRKGYSADNITFGSGGALLQKLNRDTQSIAFKCSAIRVNGEWRDVWKDPITDQGKQSKKGRVKTYCSKEGGFLTVNQDNYTTGDFQMKWTNCMGKVFENGTFLVDQSLDEIRERAY